MGRIIFRFFLQEESSLRKMSNSFHFQHSNQVIFSWSTAGVKFPKTLRVIFWVDSFVAFYQKEYFCNVSANLCWENSFKASLQIRNNSSIFVETIVLKHLFKYVKSSNLLLLLRKIWTTPIHSCSISQIWSPGFVEHILTPSNSSSTPPPSERAPPTPASNYILFPVLFFVSDASQ